MKAPSAMTPTRTVAVTITLLAAAALIATLGLPQLAPAPAAAQSPEERAALKYAGDLSLAFQSAAEAIAPSVVNITATQRVARRGGARRGDPFDLFENPFGWLNPQPDEAPDNRFFERRGQASGVVARADGYILTNNHVVAGADEVRVTLSSGRQYTAEVVGTDRETDLAVIRIDAGRLTPARFGDSSELQVGQWVIAVGTPFGLDQTVTAGIISAKGRANLGIASYENFIQTDAAINPGNSGGPLVNLRGEVIGLNTAIITRTGGYQGIGFATPSNMARRVMDAILDEGRVVRGWLGVFIQSLDEDLAESFGFEGTEGVLVSDVTPDGPADEAGLEAGDIVVELDGRRTTTQHELRNRIAAIRPGKRVELGVFRDGEERTVRVRLGERPPFEELAFGVTVLTLTEALAEQLGARTRRGVVVTAVRPRSPADRVGLELGDIILEFGDRRIEDAADFRRALRELDPDEGVRIRVQREGSNVFLMMK